MTWKPIPWGLRRVASEFHAVVHEIACQCKGSLISGLRTPEKNDSLRPKSVEFSLHQLGLAEDYQFPTNDLRDLFSKMCMEAGFQTSPKNFACHVEFDAKWWLGKHLPDLRSDIIV